MEYDKIGLKRIVKITTFYAGYEKLVGMMQVLEGKYFCKLIVLFSGLHSFEDIKPTSKFIERLYIINIIKGILHNKSCYEI